MRTRMTRRSKELFDAKIKNATLELQVKALERELQRDAAEVTRIREQFAEERRSLRENLEVALDRAHEAEKRAEVFKDRLDLISNHLPAKAPDTPDLSMNEDEEDLEYAFRTGLIDRGELEAELEAAGLINSNIDFNLTPRL